ncbi:hypothetical protein OH77DRAFT_1417236 [Trametes cingulata]|nr:hypothetical protein OH77DRAFT_1417236 [Trametes cingulata]
MAPTLSLDDLSATSSSLDVRASVATESDCPSERSTATVVEPAADVRSSLRGERRVLLERIREGTNNRSSLTSHTMPPTPPASSRPTSMAESASRPTSFIEVSSVFGTPPPRPPSRGTSATSTTSTRTVRPSLFDLLVNPSSSSVRQSPQDSPQRGPREHETAVLNDSAEDHARAPEIIEPDILWKILNPASNRGNRDSVSSGKPPSPKLLSIHDMSAPRTSTFVAPPPPILFSNSRPSHVTQPDGDVIMRSPCRSGVRARPVDKAQSSAQHAQSEDMHKGHDNTRPRTSSTTTMGDSSREARHCCSVEQGKAEIKELMEKFKRDFEEKMVKTFGEGWDKETHKADERLSSLPSPPTHRPTLPSRVNRLSRTNFWPPPPPPPQFVPPPPPPPLYVPHVPPPCIPPPPPPPRVVPPPPMPVPFHFNHAKDIPGIRIIPNPTWMPTAPAVPHVAFNPTRETATGKDSSGVERRDSEESVHDGVRCDYCNKRNIKGIRYKCLECPDYDLCQACMASPGAWEGHDREHAFFPVHTPDDFVQFCVVKDKRQRSQAVHKGISCDGCNAKNISGVRHKCLQCEDYDLCDSCVADPKKREAHNVAHSFFPIVSPGKKDAYNEARSRTRPASSTQPVILHPRVHCDECHQLPLVGVRHKCLDCDDYDLCTSCMSNPDRRSGHNASHAFFPVTTPGDLGGYQMARARHNHPLFGRGDQQSSSQDETNRADRPPMPLQPAQPVHKNIICDSCNHEIVGVRHKCLDCPDFDLCSGCYATPFVRSQHHSAHEFFAIEKPGEVIVHTVFSGDGEREPDRPTQHPARENAARARPRDVEPVVHNAMCNLCDSRIRGDRFKCLDCPDYDLCQLCYKIVNEQHPGHGFVKVSEPAILMPRNRVHDPVHNASCNVCGNRIIGVRYKCMNETCPDFDLCEACEAHPIPLHPATHPLLKVKSAETRIPTLRDPSQNTPCGVGHEGDIVDEPMFEEPIARTPEVFESSPIPQPYRVYAPPPPQVRPLPEITPEIQRDIPMFPPDSVVQQVARFHSYMSERASNGGTPPRSPSPMVQSTSAPFFSGRTSDPAHSPEPAATNPFEHILNVIEAINVGQAIQSLHGTPQRTPLRTPSPLTPSPRVPAPMGGLFERVISISEAAARPATETEGRLIDLDEPATRTDNGLTAEEHKDESHPDGFTTPSELPVSSSSSNSVPRLGPVNNEWRELWPEVTSLLKHLLQPPSPAAGTSGPSSSSGLAMPGGMFPEDAKNEESKAATSEDVEMPPAMESPLVGEPLLCRPLMPERPLNPFTSGRRLSDLILGAPPVRVAARNVRESIDRLVPQAPSKPPVTPAPLLAAFVSDNNIADGQIFPPGAEFVKSWRMRNNGERDWPETTDLVFVAGDRMAPHDGAPRKVHVGAVKAGEEVEVVAGEMKAPEVPGKYVSSWRLSDGEGNLFGHSVWVDITVAELNESSSESLASSSVIMPQTAPQPPSTRSAAEHVYTRLSTPSMTLPSAPPSEGGSSVSLIDIPSSSSSSSSDDAIYEDSRSRVLVSPALTPQDVEYVMLFDSSSEDE